MLDFDVILGIDRLSSHHTILDCYAKTVALALLGIPSVVWQSAYRPHTDGDYIFYASPMVGFFGESSLTYVSDVYSKPLYIDYIPVVREFIDVFLTDLLSSPLKRDIDFTID